MTYIFNFLLSLMLTLGLYKILLPRFRALSLNQSVSEYSLKEFQDKPVTPTMGGVIFILVSLVVSYGFVLITDPTNIAYWMVALTFIGYGIIGFVDDYKIIKSGKNHGLSSKEKLFYQTLIVIIFYLLARSFIDPTIKIPFIANPVNLGILYIVLVLFMFVGASNAVNLTDGMDGLSSGTSIIALAPFAYFAHNQGYIELTHLLISLMGALLGYLYYNKKPAQIMMGDVGSLALGGLFAATALVLKNELLLILIGIVFVIETLSVIIQISSVKLLKRKVFPYTPIHYSFTIKGVSEEKTVLIFYVIGLIGALLAIFIGG